MRRSGKVVELQTLTVVLRQGHLDMAGRLHDQVLTHLPILPPMQLFQRQSLIRQHRLCPEE